MNPFFWQVDPQDIVTVCVAPRDYICEAGMPKYLFVADKLFI